MTETDKNHAILVVADLLLQIYTSDLSLAYTYKNPAKIINDAITCLGDKYHCTDAERALLVEAFMGTYPRTL